MRSPCVSFLPRTPPGYSALWADRRGRPLRPIDRGGGSQGAGERRGPLMGPTGSNGCARRVL